MRSPLAILASALVIASTASLARADELTQREQEMVTKGLDWLAKNQFRDGHWEANGGHYPVTMTAMAGVALLMEGSTLREGKYSDNVRRAVDWTLDRVQASGLIANTNNPQEMERYMYAQGFATLFLASVYGEEDDNDRRKRLEKVLTKAVEFIGKAQTDRGGWGYVTSVDGGGFDEGSVTITQLQALRAAKNAGIVVPKSILDKAVKYLKDCTTERGGIIYSLSSGRAMGGERPPLTAAAVACSFSAGDYNSDYAKRWIEFCRQHIPIDKTGRDTFHWEYTHYYYAQAIYVLGNDRYAQLFPKAPADQHLTWKKYKEIIFDFLHSRQNADGSWSISHVGPVFSTAACLTMLQLDNATLPIHNR
jgi:hypothetical protein